MEKPDFKNFSRSWIYHATFDLIEGKSDPNNAHLLLEYFCYAFDNQQKIPKELMQYLRNSFRNYLDNEQAIDIALGLKMKKGRPKANVQTRICMATDVLRMRMLGKSHQDALWEVSQKFKCAESIVGEAWSEWQLDAILKLRMEKLKDIEPWTESELERLDKIFSKKPWYLKPGKPRPENTTPGK